MSRTQKVSPTPAGPSAYLQEIKSFLMSIDMRTPTNKQLVVYQSSIVSRAGNNKEVVRKGFEMARELGATIV